MSNWDGKERRAMPSGIGSDIAVIKEKVESTDRRVGKIDETIHGNGKTGLVVKVDRNTSFRRAITWFVGGLFGSGTLTAIILGIIKYF
jgi:hypothetical protein